MEHRKFLAIIKGKNMKNILLILLFISFTTTACSSMHDGKGWEHEGDPNTHADTTPYIFEHKH